MLTWNVWVTVQIRGEGIELSPNALSLLLDVEQCHCFSSLLVGSTVYFKGKKLYYLHVTTYYCHCERGVHCFESLHIGSQCFSMVRNFTMSTCPFMAARVKWSISLIIYA